ncbi:MAG: carbon-nitrogen hydrolase family protein [Sedimentisphaerales bacterium]|nr:carbon-nitrogen hydrolase family protein [Sedimentisphaerales bacterium]
MAQGIIRIATCQFAVTADIAHNARQIRHFIEQADEGGADLAHFPECALSGYAGVDMETLAGYDWELLRSETRQIMDLAGQKKIWIALGSMHELTTPNKAHNCLYLIGPDGRIVDRYDKRFCTPMDLDNYTPGDRFVWVDINGVRCGLLICFDLRFPELYRELYKAGVHCVIQSFYNARQGGPSVHSEIMRQTMQCRAATNGFWASMANSSAWFAPYPSCFIQPDGRIVNQLGDHREEIMINTVDLSQEFYDPMKSFRELAINGKLTNGSGTIDDPRSKDVTQL